MYTHATGCFVRDTPNPHSPFAGEPFWEHCIGYEGWRWELVAGTLYMIERIYREVRARQDTAIVRVIRHPFGKYLDFIEYTAANMSCQKPPRFNSSSRV
jgi:NADPH oxidase